MDLFESIIKKQYIIWNLVKGRNQAFILSSLKEL